MLRLLAPIALMLLGRVLLTVPLSVPDLQMIAVVAVIALIVVEAAKATLPRLKLA